MSSVDGSQIQRPGQLNSTAVLDAGQSTGLSRPAKVAVGIARALGAIVTLGISELVIRGIQNYKARQAATSFENARANQLLQPRQMSKEEIRAKNTEMGKTYSQSGGIGKDFVDLAFADIRRKMGHDKPFGELSNQKESQLRETIQKRIANSRSPVKPDQAYGIVRENVMRAVCEEMFGAEVAKINSSLSSPVELSTGRKDAFIQQALRDIRGGSSSELKKLAPEEVRDVVRAKARGAVNAEQNKALAGKLTSDESLKPVYDRLSKELGLNVAWDKVDQKLLKEKVDFAITVVEAQQDDGSFNKVSSDRANEIMEAKVKDMISTKKSLLDEIDKCGASEHVKEMMVKHALDNNIKHPFYFKAGWELRSVLKDAFSQLSNSKLSNEERLQILRQASKSYNDYTVENREGFSRLDPKDREEFASFLCEINIETSGLDKSGLGQLSGLFESGVATEMAEALDEQRQAILDQEMKGQTSPQLGDERAMLTNMLELLGRMQYFVREAAK